MLGKEFHRVTFILINLLVKMPTYVTFQEMKTGHKLMFNSLRTLNGRKIRTAFRAGVDLHGGAGLFVWM